MKWAGKKSNCGKKYLGQNVNKVRILRLKIQLEE